MENDESEFDDLLKRYLKDEVSEEERIKIEAWLDSNKKRHGKNFTWDEKDEQILYEKITTKINNIDEITSFTPRQKRVEHKILRWLAIAASISAIVITGYVAWDALEARRTSVAVAATHNDEKVKLPDGSIVWLERGSTFSFYQDNEGRHSVLNGEGLFEVSKNKTKPFNVQCGKVNVMVTGTSFNIRTAGDSFAIEVLTGAVAVSTNDDTVLVHPKEKVLYEPTGVLVRSTFDVDLLAEANSEYYMKFESVAMAQVMERIASKFEVTVRAENENLKRCRITADFTDRSLESTLQMLSEVLDISFNINGANVVITGAGCE